MKLRTASLIMTALVTAAFSLFVPTASAENSQALSISPPLIELKGDPGQTLLVSIKLTNISGDDLLMKTQFNDFGAKNETGEPKILFDEDTEPNPHSLRNWIGAPAPFTIAGKQTKTVDFPITIPKDAEPGGHYAVILFSAATPPTQNGVAITASVGSLVMLHVSGTTDEKASIAGFFTTTADFTETGFFETSPITFVERIKNEGNVHIKPTGTVEIFDTFGQKVETLRVNGAPGDTTNPPKSILPSGIRRFDQTSNSNFMFGYYRARVELTYGSDSKPLFASISFWVIPYKLILAGLAGLTALFFLLRFAIKRYNRHIIQKASKGGLRLKK